MLAIASFVALASLLVAQLAAIRAEHWLCGHEREYRSTRHATPVVVPMRSGFAFPSRAVRRCAELRLERGDGTFLAHIYWAAITMSVTIPIAAVVLVLLTRR
jgi:hypothetical protein